MRLPTGKPENRSEQLVCFTVHPATADDTLLQAFHAFDLALAHALGIEIFRNQQDERYDIAVILAQDWWDDCAGDGPQDPIQTS